MAAKKQTKGLCFTCNQGVICVRRPGFKQPVLFCEQFDDSMKVPVGKSTASLTGATEVELCAAAMGLCANCGNKKSCISASTPGGIWHCEEYA